MIVVTAKWIGAGTDNDPYAVELPAKHAGKGWSVIPDQADPKTGASVKVNVF